MNDVLYKNGQIYTVDDSRSWAEAVAVKDGRIKRYRGCRGD